MESLFWRRYLDYSRPVPFSVRYLQTPSQYPQSTFRPLHQHKHYYSSSSYRSFSSAYRVLYVNGKRVKVYSSAWENKTIDSADQKAVVLKVRKKRKMPSLILLAPRRCWSHQDLSIRTNSVWSDHELPRQRCTSFSERYLGAPSKPHRRCYSYQDVSTLKKYPSQSSLSNLSISHFWGWGNRRWVSNVDLLSPSSAYGSLEDLQYYSGHRTRSTEYLFPMPFSKWYSSSQSESGFSGSGFHRSPRIPLSVGGSDFGDYRTSSMFGDFRSASRSSSVFGDNIELSLPAKYERYDADFNLMPSPRSGAGSEMEECGRHSRAGSVFSGSELSYTEMGAAPNILESSLKSHDWVSKTDFECHAGYGTDDETMSIGSIENVDDGEFVSMHDQSLDVVYEDDDGSSLTGEVSETVDEEELDDAESLNSSDTNSVVCVTDVVIVNSVLDDSGKIISEDVAVFVDGNSAEKLLTVEDISFASTDNLKIDIKEVKTDSEMESLETIDPRAKLKIIEITGTEIDKIIGTELGEITRAEVREITGSEVDKITGTELGEITGTELGEITGVEVRKITRSEVREITDISEITETEIGETVENYVESEHTKYEDKQTVIQSDDCTLPVMTLKTGESLDTTESVLQTVEATIKQNSINNSASSTEKRVHLVSADVTAKLESADSTHLVATTDGDSEVAGTCNNDTGRTLQRNRYIQEDNENTFDSGLNYSDQQQNNVTTENSFQVADENSQDDIENKVTDVYILDKKQSGVGVIATDKNIEAGAQRVEEENTATEISGGKHDPTGLLKNTLKVSEIESQTLEFESRTQKLEPELIEKSHEDWYADKDGTKPAESKTVSVTDKDLSTSVIKEKHANNTDDHETDMSTETNEEILTDNVSRIKSKYDLNVGTDNLNSTQNMGSTQNIHSTEAKHLVNTQSMDSRENINKPVEQLVSTCTDFSVCQPLDNSTEANLAGVHIMNTSIISEPVTLHAAGSYEIGSENNTQPVMMVTRDVFTTNTSDSPDSIYRLSETGRNYLIAPTADQHAFKTDGQVPAVTDTDSCGKVLFEEYVSQTAQSDYAQGLEGSKQPVNKLDEPVPVSLDLSGVNRGLSGEKQNEKTAFTDETENTKLRAILHEGNTGDDSGENTDIFTEHSVVTVLENSESGLINDSKQLTGTENRIDSVNTLGSEVSELGSEVSESKSVEFEKESVNSLKESPLSETGYVISEKGSVISENDTVVSKKGTIVSDTGSVVSEIKCDSAILTPKVMEQVEYSFDQLTEGFDETEAYGSEPNRSKLTSSCESIDSGYDTLKKSWTKSREGSSNVKKRLFTDTDEILSVSENEDSFIDLEETSTVNDVENQADKMFFPKSEKQIASCDRQEQFEKTTAPKRLKVHLTKRTYKITKTDVDIRTTHKRDNVVDAVKHTHLLKVEKTIVTAQGPVETPTIIIDQSQIGKEITVADWSKDTISSSADLQHVSHVKNAVEMLEDGKRQSTMLDSSEKNVCLKLKDIPNVLVTATLKRGSEETDEGTDSKIVGNDAKVRFMIADTPDILDIMDDSVCDVENNLASSSTIPDSETCVVHVVSETNSFDSNNDVAKSVEDKSHVSQSEFNTEKIFANSETADKEIHVKPSKDYLDIDSNNTMKYSDSNDRKDVSVENPDTPENQMSQWLHYHEDTRPDTPERLRLASNVLTQMAEQSEVILSLLDSQSVENTEEQNIPISVSVSDPSKIYLTENNEISSSTPECDSKRQGEFSANDAKQGQHKNPLLESHDLLTGDNVVNEVTQDSGSQYNKSVDLAETSHLEDMINGLQQQTDRTDSQQVNVESISYVCDNENNDKSSKVRLAQHRTHFLGKDNFPESFNQDTNICTTGNTDVQSDIGIRDNAMSWLLTQVVDRGPRSNMPDNKLSDEEKTEFFIQPENDDGLKDLYNSEEENSSTNVGRRGIFTSTEDERAVEIQSGSGSHSVELGNRTLTVYRDKNGDVNKGYVSAENNVFDNRDISDLSTKVVGSRAQVGIPCVNSVTAEEASSPVDISVSDIYDGVKQAGVSSTSTLTSVSSVEPLETSVLQNNREAETGVCQPITADTRALIGDNTETSLPRQRQLEETDYTVLQQTDRADFLLYDHRTVGQSIHHEAGSKPLESEAITELIIGPETLAPSPHSGDVVCGQHARADKETEHAGEYSATDNQLFLIGNDKRDVEVRNSSVTVNVTATVNRCKIHGLVGCCDETCGCGGGVVTDNSSDREVQSSTMNRSREVEYYDNVGFNSVLEIIEEGLEIIEEDIQQINKDNTNKPIRGVTSTETTDEKPVYIPDPGNRLDFLREQLLFTSEVDPNEYVKPFQTSEGFLRAADSTEDLSAGNVRTVKVTGELSDTSLDTSFSSDQVDNSSWCEDVADRFQVNPDHSNSALWLEEHQKRNPQFASIHRVDDVTFEYSSLTISEDNDDDSRWITDSIENDNSSLKTDSKESDSSKWIDDSIKNDNSRLNTDSTQNDNSEWIVDSNDNDNSKWITDSKETDNSEWITDSKETDHSKFTTDSKETDNSKWTTDSKQFKECTHHGHVHSFSDEQLKRNLQSFEELLKGFDSNSEESVLSKLVFTVVFPKTTGGMSYIEKMRNLYHILLLEDMERLQNHLCPVIYGSLQLDSHRMQRYLLRGYSRDMATVWHTKRKRVLGSLLEQREDLCYDDEDNHLQEDLSPSLQTDISSFQGHHGTHVTSDHASQEFHRLSNHPGHYKVITGNFSPVPKLRQTDCEERLSPLEGEDNSDLLMDYSCVSTAADDDSRLMEEFEKLQLLKEDGLLLDDQFQRLLYYRSRFIKYNPYLQNNAKKNPNVPFRNTSTSDEDMDVN